jgi:hypothetical protein
MSIGILASGLMGRKLMTIFAHAGARDAGANARAVTPREATETRTRFSSLCTASASRMY